MARIPRHPPDGSQVRRPEGAGEGSRANPHPARGWGVLAASLAVLAAFSAAGVHGGPPRNRCSRTRSG